MGGGGTGAPPESEVAAAAVLYPAADTSGRAAEAPAAAGSASSLLELLGGRQLRSHLLETSWTRLPGLTCWDSWSFWCLCTPGLPPPYCPSWMVETMYLPDRDDGGDGGHWGHWGHPFDQTDSSILKNILPYCEVTENAF